MRMSVRMRERVYVYERLCVIYMCVYMRMCMCEVEIVQVWSKEMMI
jgi:hypothetical protein